MHEEFQKMQKRLDITRKRNEKTLIFIYYRGDGGVDGRSLDTYAILKNEVCFPIEHRIRELARIE
jgi:hypothetical protein